MFDLLGRDAERVRALFRKVETRRRLRSVRRAGQRRRRIRKVAQYGFVSGKSAHADRLATIRDVQRRYGVTIDTHTADGVKVAREHLSAGRADDRAGDRAAGQVQRDDPRSAGHATPSVRRGFENIEALPQRFDVMPADVDKVKAFIAAHTGLVIATETLPNLSRRRNPC